MLISTLITVYLLFFVMGNHDTSAWFVSETKAHGYMENVTTEDLLFKTAEVISYETGGIVTVKVELTNISEVEIPIQFNGYDANLSPDETFSEVFHEQVPMDVTEIYFQLTGFNNYINELLTIPLDQTLLLDTFPKEPVKAIELNDAEPDDTESKASDEDEKVTVPGDNDGTTKPGDNDGTTKPGDNNGTTKPGDNDGTTKPGDIDGTTKPGDNDGITVPDNQVGMDSKS